MPTVLSRDLSENALGILKDRYFEPHETAPREMFRRVAGGNEEFEKIMSALDFLPNSPTLMNAGTRHEGKSTFSACFKFDVADTMLDGDDSIMETGRKAASVAKWGGGVGYYLGNIRAKGQVIRSVHRVACGPISCLKFYNTIGTQLITQGGRRELAQMGILPVTHPDIREFIHVKDTDPQALKTFNISVSATDEFMKKVMAGQPCEELKLWDEIVDSAWKTGDPGFYFFDTANRFNPTPHLGLLTGTNPCGEVPLLNNEACNLGSINLGNFVTVNHAIDYVRLEKVVRIAIRFLDNILDRNCFPHKAITDMVALTRKLGLGVMGWADMLALLNVHYDSDQALEIGNGVMSHINKVAADESELLGNEKGCYPGWDGGGSRYRNATRTCIAPTGSISILADASSGVEPHYALGWERKLHAGHEREKVIHEKVSVMNRIGSFVPHTAMEIAPSWHVRHQATFQKHTDLAVSKTVNLPESATRQDISSTYKLMWEQGCKGGTIYRDKCRAEQVLTSKPHSNGTAVNGNGHTNGNGHVVNRIESNIKAMMTEEDNKFLAAISVPVSDEPKIIKNVRRKPTKDRDGKIHHMTIGLGEFDGYLTAGMYPDGSLCEIFIKASKEGSTVSGMLDSWAIAFSHAIQHGDPLEAMVKKYTGMRFEPNGLTQNPDIPICTSIVDYIVRWLDKHFGAGRNDVNHKGYAVQSGMFCPDCQGPAIRQSGCLECVNRCGWSKCG